MRLRLFPQQIKISEFMAETFMNIKPLRIFYIPYNLILRNVYRSTIEEINGKSA